MSKNGKKFHKMAIFGKKMYFWLSQWLEILLKPLRVLTLGPNIHQEKKDLRKTCFQGPKNLKQGHIHDNTVVGGCAGGIHKLGMGKYDLGRSIKIYETLISKFFYLQTAQYCKKSKVWLTKGRMDRPTRWLIRRIARDKNWNLPPCQSLVSLVLQLELNPAF